MEYANLKLPEEYKTDTNYNTIGVIKSQLCSAIVKSEAVRRALDFKGADCDNYDPSDPFTLIHNCVIPWLQYPETITTTEPMVFLGVKLSENPTNHCLSRVTVTILCSVDKSDMRTSEGYFRDDLLKKGCVCYTKVDHISDEIMKCISAIQGTWIGDIENIESAEYAMTTTRYCRSIVFRLLDVNVGVLMQNG